MSDSSPRKEVSERMRNLLDVAFRAHTIAIDRTLEDPPKTRRERADVAFAALLTEIAALEATAEVADAVVAGFNGGMVRVDEMMDAVKRLAEMRPTAADVERSDAASRNRMNETCLWVDDCKPAPDGFVVARTYDDALKMLRRFDYTELYLDHDLGDDGRTGYDLLMQIIAENRLPPRVECISWNPAGRQRILAAIENHRTVEFRRSASPKDGR
jgi:hypothetical protein